MTDFTPLQRELHNATDDEVAKAIAWLCRGEKIRQAIGRALELRPEGFVVTDDMDMGRMVRALVATDNAQAAFDALAAELKPKATALHHGDDTFVDTFAAAMKAKLAQARAKGRGGWDDPNRCQVSYLAQLLIEQLQKPEADPIDVANLAMFLYHRDGGTTALRLAIAHPDR